MPYSTERYHSDEEYRERLKANRRRRYRERNEYTPRPRQPRKPKEPKPRVVRVRVPKPKVIPIPTHVRDAWKRSHRNSILQRKYPTYDALRKAAQEGAFS